MRLRALMLPLATLFAMPLVAIGAPDADQRRARFEQVREAMNVKAGAEIDREALEAFLQSKASKIAERLRSAGFVVTEQNADAFRAVSKRQAALIMNRVTGSRQVISESDLAAFEEADLEEFPFSGKVRDLLPPPPGSAAAARGGQESEIRPSKSPLDYPEEWGLSIRKSFLDAKDVGRPASVALTHFGDHDATRDEGRPSTVFDFRGALSFSPHEFKHELGGPTLVWSPVAAIEADVSTDSKVGRDKVVHRLGVDAAVIRSVTSPWWSGHIIAATFDYTTDRDYRSALLGGTAQYTPNFRLIGIGEYKQLGQLPLFVRWRPYVGVSGADVENDGDKKALEKMSSYVNSYVRASGEILFGERLHLAPEVTWFKQLMAPNRDFFLLSVGLRYSLDDKDRISIETSYTRGKDSPEFIEQDQLTFGLGIKF